MITPFNLRYMTLTDLPQVMQIDRLSFPMPWSPDSYRFELSENQTTHMIVLEHASGRSSRNGWFGTLRRLIGGSASGQIVGYGGLWMIAGEAHISTIAVHPDYRGMGLGELLLAGMVGKGLMMNADYAVLEVRVSNQRAINLYQKYGFQITDTRPDYYRDNHEAAHMMNLAPLDTTYQQRFAGLLMSLKERVDYQDHFTGMTRRLVK